LNACIIAIQDGIACIALVMPHVSMAPADEVAIGSFQLLYQVVNIRILNDSHREVTGRGDTSFFQVDTVTLCRSSCLRPPHRHARARITGARNITDSSPSRRVRCSPYVQLIRLPIFVQAIPSTLHGSNLSPIEFRLYCYGISAIYDVILESKAEHFFPS